MNVLSIVISLCIGFSGGLMVGRSTSKQDTEPRQAKPVRNSVVAKNQKVVSNIYVGNLSPDVSEKDLRETFEVFGKVQTATIIKDRSKGGHKRFAFVEMFQAAEAQAAITQLDGRDLKGRTLKVKEAHNRASGGTRSPRSRGGNRRPNKRRPDRKPQAERDEG